MGADKVAGRGALAHEHLDGLVGHGVLVDTVFFFAGVVEGVIEIVGIEGKVIL